MHNELKVQAKLYDQVLLPWTLHVLVCAECMHSAISNCCAEVTEAWSVRIAIAEAAYRC